MASKKRGTKTGTKREAAGITTRVIGPALWPAFERLFGANGGVCGGCWCMFWRLEKGESYQTLQGAPAKRRIKAGILAGKVHGVLAFDGDDPVGWCSFDRRTDFVKLDRSPSMACDDAEGVWSVPCFFVDRRYRGQGVATALLEAATAEMKRLGARTVEAYPVKSPTKGEKPVSAAFAYTGTTALFEKAGFSMEQARPKGKQRMRRRL